MFDAFLEWLDGSWFHQAHRRMTYPPNPNLDMQKKNVIHNYAITVLISKEAYYC